MSVVTLIFDGIFLFDKHLLQITQPFHPKERYLLVFFSLIIFFQKHYGDLLSGTALYATFTIQLPCMSCTGFLSHVVHNVEIDFYNFQWSVVNTGRMIFHGQDT